MGVKLIVAVQDAGAEAIAGPVIATAAIYFVEEQEPWFTYLAGGETVTRPLSEYEQFPSEVQALVRKHLRSRPATTAHVEASAVRLEAEPYQTRLDAMGLAAARAMERFKFDRPDRAAGLSREDVTVVIPGREPLPTKFLSGIRQLGVVAGYNWRLYATKLLSFERRAMSMMTLADRYPEYGFEKHHGYPTRSHVRTVRRYGLSPLHHCVGQPSLKE